MTALAVKGYDLKVEKPERILALYLTYRGFGYTIFDDPKTVVDWAHCTVDEHDPDIFRKRLDKLITDNKTNRVLSFKAKNRPSRIARNIFALKAICKEHEIGFSSLSKDDIANVFESFGSYTKYQRAGLIAAFLPELAYKLPEKRKPWAAEDLRMAIFDSATLALAYYYLKK